MSIPKKPIRNLAARSPLLRKGGPHLTSKTGKRVRLRLSTSALIDEWFDNDCYHEIDDVTDEKAGDSEKEKDINKGATAPFLMSFYHSKVQFVGHIPAV